MGNLQREIEREQQQQHQLQMNANREYAGFVDDSLRREIRRERELMEQMQQINERLARPNVSELDVSNLSYDALLDLFPNEAHGASEECIRRLPTSIFQKSGDAVDT